MPAWLRVVQTIDARVLISSSLFICASDRTKEAKPNDFIQNPDRFYIRRDVNRGELI